MKRTVCIVIVACSLTALSSSGCAENNEKTANITGTPGVAQPGEDTSPSAQRKRMMGVQPGTKSGSGSSAYPGPKRN